MRFYYGNEPDRGWRNLISFTVDEVDWTVYTKMTDPERRWLSVKVAALRGAPTKANYWVSWDRDKKKLGGRTPDAGLLKRNRPELCERLVDLLVENHRVRVW